MSGFGLVHIKAEGAPAHPDDVYDHCGCARCDAKYRKQALAHYTWLKEHGYDLSQDLRDPWFPKELL